eukprot:SAG31_NODE_9821_length_1223_cov_1.384342_2_plen_122_part_00
MGFSRVAAVVDQRPCDSAAAATLRAVVRPRVRPFLLAGVGSPGEHFPVGGGGILPEAVEAVPEQVRAQPCDQPLGKLAQQCLRRPEFKTWTPEVLENHEEFGVPSCSPDSAPGLPASTQRR